MANMARVSTILESIFSKSLQSALGAQLGEKARLLQAQVTLSRHGDADYQCNSAFKIAKLCKQSPRSTAEVMLQHLPDHGAISSVDVSGPGFVNIRLNSEWIAAHVDDVIEKYIHPQILPETERRKVLVDFASPNMCKALHVGHLRSSIIGDSIARSLEFLGHDVKRVSHVGDWGTPMAIVLTHLREQPDTLPCFQASRQAVLDGTVALPSAEHLSTVYETAKRRFDSDPAFARGALQAVKELQSSREQDVDVVGSLRHAWWMVSEASRRGYSRVLRLLDVDVEDRGESSYNHMLQGLVDDMMQRGVLFDHGGALAVRAGHDDDNPFIVQKSDGGFLYSTTDLAALRTRIEEGFDTILYVVDRSQQQHFRQLFDAAQAAGWYDPRVCDAKHIAFGLIHGQDGRKLSSRSGAAPHLMELLDTCIDATRRHLEHRDHAGGDSNSDKNVVNNASSIAIGAIRYFDLSHERNKDYNFSPEQMLAQECNTSISILYAYSRIAWSSQLTDDPCCKVPSTRERDLLLLLAQWPDVLCSMTTNFSPHILTEYLHNVALAFHRFYSNERILGEDRENFRLGICLATQKIICLGLDLVGVQTIQRI